MQKIQQSTCYSRLFADVYLIPTICSFAEKPWAVVKMLPLYDTLRLGRNSVFSTSKYFIKPFPFKHFYFLHIDSYQNTNYAECKMIRWLTSANLCSFHRLFVCFSSIFLLKNDKLNGASTCCIIL